MTQRIGRPKGFVPVRKRDNSVNRKRMDAIQRRIVYLEKRIKESIEWTDGQLDPQWDKQELRSLKWALEIAKEWVASDPLIEVEYKADLTLEQALELLGTRARYRGEGCEIVGVQFLEKGLSLTLRKLDEGDTTRPVRISEEGVIDLNGSE